MLIPYKEKIISFLDSVSDEAKEIGAVNTICFKNGNKNELKLAHQLGKILLKIVFIYLAIIII